MINILFPIKVFPPNSLPCLISVQSFFITIAQYCQISILKNGVLQVQRAKREFVFWGCVT